MGTWWEPAAALTCTSLFTASGVLPNLGDIFNVPVRIVVAVFPEFCLYGFVLVWGPIPELLGILEEGRSRPKRTRSAPMPRCRASVRRATWTATSDLLSDSWLDWTDTGSTNLRVVRQQSGSRSHTSAADRRC